MSKTIVILRYALNSDNQIPDTLRQRLQAVAKLSNPKTLIIVSGGRISKPLANKTESGAMETWLRDQLIPYHAIIQENQSASTLEDLSEVRTILLSRKIQHCTIVTSYYHLARIRYEAFGILDPFTIDWVC